MFPVVFLAVVAATTVSSNFDPPVETLAVNEGDNVTLKCEEATRFDNGSACQSFNVYFLWTSGNNWEYLTYCGQVYTEFKDRMTASKDDGLYTLTIHNVHREDAGVYECPLYGFHHHIDTLRTVVMTVTAQPNCEVHPDVPSVGTIAQLVCRVPPHAPPTQLTWLESGSRPLVSPGPTTLTSPEENYTLNINVTENVRNAEFTCVASRDLANGPRCTVIPLPGLQKVSISPSPDSSDINDSVFTGSVVGGTVGGLFTLLLAIAVVIKCVKVKTRSSGPQHQIARSQQATLAGLDISSQPKTSRYEDAPKAAATRAESAVYYSTPDDHQNNSDAAANDDCSIYVNINISQREKRSPRWKLVASGDLE